MKEFNKKTDEDLANMMFSISNTKDEIIKDNQRRDELAKIDLTYLNYPHVNVITQEIVGYPFEGWSKEEIEDYIENYDELIKEIFK